QATCPYPLHVVSSASCFFFDNSATPQFYTLSLHDALPISGPSGPASSAASAPSSAGPGMRTWGSPCGYSSRTTSGTGCARNASRSEEHTSELQSRENLVCRLLLEKKKTTEQNVLRDTEKGR